MTHPAEMLILLVEDDDAHAEMVRRSLAGLRRVHHLLRLEDGQAALDYLLAVGAHAPSEPRPDLILLDLRLPRIDGLEVLRQVRQDPSLQSIPTVVLTTSAAESDMVQAYQHGARSFLVKPIDSGKLEGLLVSLGFRWVEQDDPAVAGEHSVGAGDD